ncbi:Putative DNA ligase-like protein/MT0965 [Candidatus Rubidus massiliensis]|nr:Putative DNA ligase-like protein/MT0965 [Candidatus Rubidus massiliensis]
MGLKKYWQKRKFEETTEPKGSKKSKHKKLLFVVQKHDASHLHYDFRLELLGVLKSWAVPKGPSMNSDDKRLAIEVEDHPYEYHKFEGIIPKGNYGAGTVEIWDNGFYQPLNEKGEIISEEAFLKDLKKGHIRFNLQGKKLKGEFSLIRIQSDKKNQWLLVKKKDSFTSSNSEIELIKNLPNTPMPHQIKPMLSTLVDKPFDNLLWLFEIKWDGYRAIAEVKKGKVNLYSRSFQSFNEAYKPIVQALAKIPFDAVFDGEIVILDENGKSSFEYLQKYSENQFALTYIIFDLLYYEGKNLTSMPLIQRKNLLASVLPKNIPALQYSDHIIEKGISLYKLAKSHHLEGIMAKKMDSLYISKRTHDWLKIKTSEQQEAIICGFTKPKKSRHYFGALILGAYKQGKLTYIGRAGTGFNEKLLEKVYNLILPFKQDKPIFADAPKAKEIVWVEPKFVCEVGFFEWTRSKVMRKPVFLGLREDKEINEVVPEMAEKTQIVKKSSQNLQFTNLDKIFWPQEKYTKGDVIAYYDSVAEWILPYLKNRPMTLHRSPNGIEGPSFYQKDVTIPVPSWVKKYTIQHESREVHYLMAQNKKSLLYIVNLGCIELNPFNSRIQHIEQPDYMIIDLDPVDIEFKHVRTTALTVHYILEDLKVPHFCKTSGGRGIHICIPMGAKYTYDEVKLFGQLIAQLTHQQIPSITSLERSPKNRKKKVYLDYLQNNFGQTLASVYSVRPKPGATVSMPLEWSEVEEDIDPRDFTIKNALERIKEKGDIFKGVLKKGINLEKALEKINKKH